jgi:hypothetical protein
LQVCPHFWLLQHGEKGSQNFEIPLSILREEFQIRDITKMECTLLSSAY